MSRLKNLKSLTGLSGELHLWLGVLSSFFVLVICFTGAVLVFEKPVKAWVNHDSISVEAEQDRQAIDQIIHNFSRDFESPLRQIIIPQEKDQAVILTSSDAAREDSLTLYYNPYTAELTGQPNAFIEGFFGIILDLHKWLLVKQPGRTIVSISTFIFVIMLLTGLVLWWPKRLKSLRSGVTINFRARWKSFNYQLHNVLGFYALLLLMIMGLTGLYISQDWFRGGIDFLLEGNNSETELYRDERQQKEDFNSMQQLIDEVNKELAYSSAVVIEFPYGNDRSGTISKFRVLEPTEILVPDLIYFDPETMRITGAELYRNKPDAARYQDLNLPLHTGEIFGWPTMILYFIACLFGASLPVTGLLVWLNKFRREPYGKDRLETPEKRDITPRKPAEIRQ